MRTVKFQVIVATGEGGSILKQVPAYPVPAEQVPPDFRQYNFFLHRPLAGRQDYWVVAFETGHMVAEGPTQEDAVEDLNTRLGKTELSKFVRAVGKARRQRQEAVPEEKACQKEVL